MDGRLFYSLASADWGGIPYHALGTLDGEIFLMKELPQGQNDAEMLNHLLSNTLPEATVKTVQLYRQNLINNQAFLIDCCKTPLALQEPLRTAWVARQLLDRYGNFEPVICLLLDIQDRFDTVSRNLRAHVMGALGKHFDNLPEEYHYDFIQLCRKIRDGALASFLNSMPETIQKNNNLLLKILHITKKKIFLGKRYVSSAVLQRLRRAPDEHRQRTEQLICELLRGPANSLWHPGILEGVLAVLWNSLDVAGKGLIGSLSALSIQYPKLAKEFKRPERRRMFCDWLNRYGSTLFSTTDSCFWQHFSELVEPAEMLEESKLETLPVRLRNALQQRIGQENSEYNKLEAFLSLFPQETYRYSMTELPDEWRKIALKTQSLRSTLDQIAHQVTPIRKSHRLLESSLSEVAKPIIQSSLLENLELSWRYAWQRALRQQLDSIQVDVHQASQGTTLALEEVLARLNKAMETLGFAHGRLFHVVDVLGTDSSEILRRHVTEEFLTDESYPISKETATYLDRYTSYAQPTHFLFNAHPPVDQDPRDLAVRFWNQIPSSMPGIIRVDMPVLKKRAYGAHQGVYRPIAMLLFEWRQGYGRDDALHAYQILSNERGHLLPILNQLRNALNTILQEKKQQIDIILDAFSHQLRYTLHSRAIEEELVKTAHKLSGADSTTLLRPNEDQDKLKISAVCGDDMNLYKNQEFDLEDTFLPITTCWKSGKPIFNPDWKNSKEYSQILKEVKADRYSVPISAQMHAFWVNIGSTTMLPIHLGKRIIGVLRIHSAKPYAFDANCITSLETLFDRGSWFLYAIQSEEQQDRERYVWARTIMHELRSELIPLNAHLEAVLKEPTHRKNIQRITWGLATSQHLLDLTNNFMVIDGVNINDDQTVCENPGHAVQEFLNLHQEDISSAEEHVIVTPSEYSDPVWQKALRGHPEVFARIIRNLLHNAVKYGSETEQAIIKVNARSKGRYWELMISNPGQMTEEQDRYKFEHISPQTPDGSGAHVGLAASLKWANFYNAELDVSNITDTDGPRVLAHLRWPLAT